MNRQRMLLIVLGLLVLIAAWRYLGSGDDEPAIGPPAAARAGDPEEGGRPGPAPGAAGAARRGGERDAAPKDVLELRVAALQHDPESFTPGRDPWRFIDPPPPPPPPPHRKTAAELAAERAAAELAARLRAEAEERARIDALTPKPPPFTLKYLGSFGTAERRLAVFTDADGKTIYNVKEGGTIDGKFTVAHIGFESVDIGFVGFPDVQPLRKPAGQPTGQPAGH